ncbi:hypothetical protein [Achromobacter insuavis]|uniref:hypothetical protein n=1 Tax=Achromobacter insuavis TaxID=1287735 RepID=UPI000E30152A|nr:hypothetical protein [Achromobacter insuavis]
MSHTAAWERFLDPDVVRPSLFLATMFIAAFEILRDSVVDDVRGFYISGFGEDGSIVDSEYRSKVLSRNNSPLYASLGWLREHGAINEDDLEKFEQLKKTRNLLAHELFGVVSGQVESAHEQQFDDLIALLRKIGVWWVINVEIPTNPDFAGNDIKEEDIVPGAVLTLEMLIQVASGNTELIERWRKARARV